MKNEASSSRNNPKTGEVSGGFYPGKELLNRYALERLLGKGGMGMVWLAHDRNLDRRVILKFLPEQLAFDHSAMDDLKRGTQKCLKLVHPNIVLIHDFLEGPGWICISMEFVDGSSLSTRQAQKVNRVFETEESSLWISQLCAALSFAHERIGLVHRDLKPSNLLINRNGDLKLADFGVAHEVTSTMSRVTGQLSRSSMFNNMSPQQYYGDPPKPTDDIYSLGATLYELLTSKPLFHSGNVPQQIMKEVPPSMTLRRKELSIRGAAIPSEWEEVVAACLRKEPEARPKSVLEIAARLKLDAARLEDQKAVGSSGRLAPAREVKAVSIPPPSSPRKRGALWIAAGGVAALGLVGFAIWYAGVYLPAEKETQLELARLEAEKAASVAENARLKAETQKTALEVERLRTEREKGQRGEGPPREQATDARGGLRVKTDPAGAAVTLGDKEVGKSPCTIEDVKAGIVPLKIALDHYETVEREIEIRENEMMEITMVLTRGADSTQTTNAVEETVNEKQNPKDPRP